jgi:DNA polymerase
MIAASIQPQFDSWRDKARLLLQQRIPPAEVVWDDAGQSGLFEERHPPLDAATLHQHSITKAFLDQARTAAAHTDSQRWSVLYQLLWRMTEGKERHLLAVATDPDVQRLHLWCKAVGRDIHKMHAFVRFRLLGVDDSTQREKYAAWFEPSYNIVRLATPFFQKRFTSMDWSILTPLECAHWDGHTLSYTPGVTADRAPSADAQDELWRSYFKSIFNPARLKVKMMQQEMPKKYWKNLPEAQLISQLIADSQQRVDQMLAMEGRPVKPLPDNAYLRALYERNDFATE